jgi:iron-sulfur cluster insertion protein
MEEVLEQPQLVKMAPGAVAKIKELIAEENNPNLKLRMFVSGGGCSGMQYGFTFEEQGQEDDFVLEFDGIHLLIDSMSSQYLHGAEVDYTESLQGSQFSIKNPNAQTTCGCGSSFNPG